MMGDQVTWLSHTNKPHRSSSNWYGLAIEFKLLTSLSTLDILLLLALSENTKSCEQLVLLHSCLVQKSKALTI